MISVGRDDLGVTLPSLLVALDPDAEVAAIKYVSLLDILEQLLGGDYDLACLVLCKVGKRLTKGECIQNLYGYIKVVARRVQIDHARAMQKQLSLESLAEYRDWFFAPDDPFPISSAHTASFHRLSVSDRELLQSYFVTHNTAEKRRELARKYRISGEALRKRVQRITHKAKAKLTTAQMMLT